MKHLQSITEGTWIEIKKFEFTDEQKAILMSKDENDKEAKKSLALEIREASQVKATNKDATNASEKYNKVKPTLKDTDVYELINMYICGDRGVLNCKINSKHTQVKF